MSKPIRKRSEVAAEFTWDLTDIFPSDEAWRAEYEALRPYAEAVAAYQGRLGESAETLLAYFRLDDELNVRVGRLYGYANCKADEDTSNGFYQDLRGKALSLSVTLSGAGAFAASELLALSDETLTRFYAEQPDLATYRRPIERVRRRRAHILSPECEALLANAGEMADGPDAIFGVFHNADLRFPAVTDGAGAEQPLTDATFVPLLQSGDRTLRRNTFETYYATLGGYRNTLAATLDAQFKQLRFFANARRYPSTLDAALDAGLDVEVVPGPSAVSSALARSGLSAAHFFFEGFLPRKAGAQKARLAELARIPGTLVIYESPHRAAETIARIAEIMPGRRVALVRELTKLHEEVVRGTAADVAAELAERGEVRGECVIVVEEGGGSDVASGPELPLDDAIAAGLAAGESKSALAKRLARVYGMPKGDVYARVLELA